MTDHKQIKSPLEGKKKRKATTEKTGYHHLRGASMLAQEEEGKVGVVDEKGVQIKA
jgi:hypothetical protein